MDKKKIAITGGAGFIGSYIARELVEKGYTPVIIDSFTQYLNPLLTMEYNKVLKKRLGGIEDKIVMERGNPANYGEIRRILTKHKPEKLIHLAAMPISTISNVHIEECLEGTIKSTTNMIDIAKEENFLKRFIYTSSSMVYGDFKQDPISEDALPEPKDTYAGAKLAGEALTKGMCRRFKIPYTIIRPSAVYGPTDMNGRVSQLFIENAILNKPLILKGGGKNKLDFTYVKDTAHGFVLATLKPEGENETFNITTGNARSLAEYANIVKKFYPDAKIIEEPVDPNMPVRGSLDISKAKKLLNYKPQYSLETALPEYISYLRDEIESGKYEQKSTKPQEEL